jgi:membrane associated rhomboid family serine protease
MFPIRDTIPSRRTPLMMWALIAANAAVFVHELRLGGGALERLFAFYGVVPALLGREPRAWLAEPRELVPLVTSMFLHGGWLHVLGNLWTLSIFGDNVEDRMGPLRFLVFYLLCGVVAGMAHVYFNPDSSVPTVGASGAISGVMGAYFFLYPRARVITLIPILFYPLFVELSAFVFLGLWFAAQLLSGAQSMAEPEAAGGIAFLAHVGGFATGALTHWIFLRRER